MAFDIYSMVTDRIIQQLESGLIPWRKPWIAAGSAISHTTGKAYSLLNQMLLNKPGEWLTFTQIQNEGGKIRKGEKASAVVFWKWLEKQDEQGEENPGEVKKIPFLKYFNVWHIDQCEGIKAKFAKPLPNTATADQTAETIMQGYIDRSGVKLSIEESDRAYYQSATDRVVIPLMAQFDETAEFYSTAFHELIHSTGHESRLNRLARTAFFGSEDYSKEELIAEIGASALVNRAGLETAKSFRNSAAYVQNWLSVLRDDKRFIVSASGCAEKAVAMILGE